MVRSTMDVPPAAIVDETAVQNFVDDVADRHGLRCSVCDPLNAGRVYVTNRGDGPSTLVVNFDGENRTLFFATTGYDRDGRRGVRALSEDLRAEIAEQFPGITATTFEDTFELSPELSTTFDIVPSGSDVEAVEGAKRTLSSIVEESVRIHGLQTDPTSLVYYTGRRVGVSAAERDFVVVPSYENNAELRIRVASNTPRFDELQRVVSDALAQRLNAAFGPANVKTFQRARELDWSTE
jgi:hypothetical protein